MFHKIRKKKEKKEKKKRCQCEGFYFECMRVQRKANKKSSSLMLHEMPASEATKVIILACVWAQCE